MGMLQLAGAVSGFGKGLQQGLQQTQQYMSQSLLLEERDKNERDRMKLTFAHDEGMLQKRAAVEETAADKLHSRTLDRDERREDFEMRKGRIERDAARTDEATKYERQKERDAKTQENTVTNKVLDASYDQQKEATKSKQDRAKEERDRQAKREELQVNSGTRLVEQMLQNQRPTGGGSYGARLDPAIASRTKDLDLEIDALLDERKSIRGDIVMKDEKKKAALDEIDRKIMEVRNKKNKLIGQPEELGATSTRQPIRWPE